MSAIAEKVEAAIAAAPVETHELRAARYERALKAIATWTFIGDEKEIPSVSDDDVAEWARATAVEVLAGVVVCLSDNSDPSGKLGVELPCALTIIFGEFRSELYDLQV